MKVYFIFFVTLSLVLKLSTCDEKPNQPNIIFMLADDAGWNDFSFHGSPQIPTPNIDALALNGVVLNSYYAAPLCTPSRGAIMAGKHPIHLRLQHYVIMGGTGDGLPLKEKLLPEYLKDVGYSTHMVGKWHLGHAHKVFSPTYRGFDSHVGYWLGKQDYYDHISREGGTWGYDFRRNMTVDYDAFGVYGTDIFTDESLKVIHNHPKNKPLFLMINHIAPHSANAYMPLQAPKENVEKFHDSIQDIHRRKYAAMVDKLDESVGLVVDALAERNMLENSIIIFGSDNGGAAGGFDNSDFASNWPLRGGKNTLWEGGTRLAACIWSPLLKSRVSEDLFHAQDWLPTLYEAVGGDIQDLGNIDGLSMWKTLTEAQPSPRVSMLYNIDDLYNNSAVRFGNWKLIQGNTSTYDLGAGDQDVWFGPSGRNRAVNKAELIPKILDSYAGKAVQKALGKDFSLLHLYKMQNEAEIRCGEPEPIICDAFHSPCLFNIKDDPCEMSNLAAKRPDIAAELLEFLRAFNETALPPIPRYRDPKSDPLKWNFLWTNWKDDEQNEH